jgi:excisionase family DNA binding protein
MACAMSPADFAGDFVSERLLTAAELAGYLGLKPGTVLDKWERGEFPGYKFGRAVRFDLEEVLATGRPDAGRHVSSEPPAPGQGGNLRAV